MRAIVCHGPGEVEDLRLEEVAPPALPAGHVRIRVRAAGVNFADLLIVKGSYQDKPAYPFSPGMEAAGVVAELAPDVDGGDLRVGDRVLASLAGRGGYAEEAVARIGDVTRIPDAMDWPTAAAFQLAYMTSYLALTHRARLEPGEALLVHGASGGVGLAAVEIGAILGANVIASASSPEKLEIARQHGAQHLLNYAAEDIRDRVLALTGGADVVFDPVGGDAFRASLRCINPGGRILVVGFASGDIPQIPANHLLVKDAAALGFGLGHVRRRRPEVVHEGMRTLLDWYEQGRLRPHVDTFPLDRFAEAMALLRDRRSAGKVVLEVSKDEPMTRIAVIGSGAVGGYYGARLAQAGREVHFLMRRDLETVRHGGLEVRSKDGDFRLDAPLVHGSSAEIGPVDWVICALKATAVEEARALIEPCIGPGTRLVLLMNGLGLEERFAEWFGAERVFGGLAFTCINREGPVIHHIDYGAVTIGHYLDDAAAVEEAVSVWAGAKVEVAQAPSLLRARWRKLLWNIPFNGLAVTAGGITTDVIMGTPDLRAAAEALMREVVDTANADLEARGQAPLEGAREMSAMLSMTETMATYRPSTMIDFVEGRPLEVEAIFGEPLRRARSLGVDTPYLALLTAQMHALDPGR